MWFFSAFCFWCWWDWIVSFFLFCFVLDHAKEYLVGVEAVPGPHLCSSNLQAGWALISGLTNLLLSSHQVRWSPPMFNEQTPTLGTSISVCCGLKCLQIQMFCVASHRLLHFISLIIDLCQCRLAGEMLSKTTVPSGAGGGGGAFRNNVCENAGDDDDDGRARSSRLPVLANDQRAVAVLLHANLCSSFCRHATVKVCKMSLHRCQESGKFTPACSLGWKSAVEICTTS